MPKIKSNCLRCGKEFEHWKSERGKFCSYKCYWGERIETACAYCDVEIKLKKSNFDRSKHNFCSKECSWKYKKGKPSPSHKTTFKKRNIPLHKKDINLNEVVKLYEKGWSIEKLSEKYGYKGICTRIAKHIKQLGLSRESGFQKEHLFSKGKRNPAFDGWKSRQPYGQKFSPKIKEEIRKRDSYRCQQCFRHQSELFKNTKAGIRNYKLHIHHIDFNKNNNKPDNLISLCINCHGQTQFDRQSWIKYFQKKIGDTNA